MENLRKDKEDLFRFYDYPAEHWTHIRTSNPIESTFATVRLRHKSTKGSGTVKATEAMAFKLYQQGGAWQAQMLSLRVIHDPMLKTRNPMEGITVSSSDALELVAQAVNSHDSWKEEGWVPVVFTNSRSQISAVNMYPEDFLTQNNALLLHQLQETARQTGAVMALPWFSPPLSFT